MNCRKFPKFPYRGGKFSKVGNYCGNLSLPSGNLLVCDLVTLNASLFYALKIVNEISIEKIRLTSFRTNLVASEHGSSIAISHLYCIIRK